MRGGRGGGRGGRIGVREGGGGRGNAHEKLSAGLKLASELLRVERKPDPAWYQDSATTLRPLVESRQAAQTVLDSAVGEEARQQARRAHWRALRAVNKGVKHAKLRYLGERFDGLRPHRAPGRCWQEVTKLRSWLGSTRPTTALPAFKNAAGVVAASTKDSTAALVEHHKRVFNLPSSTAPTAFDNVKQRELLPDLANPPTIEEILLHTRAASREKAAGESGFPAEYYQALLDPEDFGLDLWVECVREAWETGECPPEWVVRRLKLLYKGKGERADLKNWRGIMLLEPAAKIVCAIISTRLGPLVDLEEQCGFRPGRGTTDGLFTLKLALQKCKEQQLDTHALFVDLKKAFDSLPRDGIYTALARFGVPEHLIKLVRAFHTGVEVKIATGNPDDPDVTVESGVGVKQGDSLAPVLFNLLFQACMEAMDATWPAGVSKPTFAWKADGKIMGRVVKTVGASFEFNRELYADDACFLFVSRAELQLGLVHIFDGLKAFGLEMHVGTGGGAC